MKYCPTCNSDYDDKFRSCPTDRATLLVRPTAALPEEDVAASQIAIERDDEPAEESVVSATSANSSPIYAKYCPSCNSKYENRFRFCRLDGTTLIEKSVPESTPAENKDERIGGELADEMGATKVSEPLIKPSDPSRTETPKETPNGQQAHTVSSVSSAVIPEDVEKPSNDLSERSESETAGQDFRSKPLGGKGFEFLVQQEIKKVFPNAFVRAGVQIRSLRRSAEVDLFVLMPRGLFLIECKNYSGKIRGSFNYDQKQGEFWTCQTTSGEIVQITSTGKNPADQALTRFHALHDMAKDVWGEGEANRPYICPVLLFPDAADLSGITQMTVYPDRPSSADRVVATTLSKLLGYLASADSLVDPVGALKLIDFLGIPRFSLSGTWLVAQSSHVDISTAKEKQQSDRQQPEQTRQDLNEGGLGTAAHEYRKEIAEGARPDVRVSSPPRKQRDEVANEHIKSVPPKATSRKVRWPLIGFAVVMVALIGLMVVRELTSKPPIETISKNIVSPQPASPQQPSVAPLPPMQPKVQSSPPSESVVGPRTTPADKGSTAEPQKPLDDTNREARVQETAISRRPAEPGNYETISITNAHREPNDRADVVDELRGGTKLNVTGSQGEWLVVRSRTRQMTVYVKRDDAMFVSVRNPGGDSYQEAEARWKKVEADITESLAKWGVTGVTASFRGDTAYLEGQVKTDYERFRAEMAAKSIVEVQYIYNRIRLNP